MTKCSLPWGKDHYKLHLSLLFLSKGEEKVDFNANDVELTRNSRNKLNLFAIPNDDQIALIQKLVFSLFSHFQPPLARTLMNAIANKWWGQRVRDSRERTSIHWGRGRERGGERGGGGGGRERDKVFIINNLILCNLWEGRGGERFGAQNNSQNYSSDTKHIGSHRRVRVELRD